MKNDSSRASGRRAVPAARRFPSPNSQRRPAAHGPVLGVVEWFRPGGYDQVEQVLEDLRAMHITDLRTGLSWADYHTTEGQEWYGWLLPRLSREVRVLPCFRYTPPSIALAPRSSAPPRRPKDYADFLDVLITRYGEHFEWIELWNEPNNIAEWDWTLDPDWRMFSEMITAAAHWVHRRGKKTVLAGMSPIDPNWLRLMARRGVLAEVDAVGIHGFPGVWEATWEGWPANVEKVRAVLDEFGSPARIWITETGYSTWQHDEFGQARAFARALEAPVDRVYWHAARDLQESLPTRDGFHVDEREYHFGLRHADGRPKLLSRLWAKGGRAALRELCRLGERKGPLRLQGEKHTLVTGGAGFIGANVADRLLRDGRKVLILDNLSRPGVEENVRWLLAAHGERLQIDVSDIRDPHAVRRAVRRAEQVFHFTAQVAVTTSLTHPVDDFEVNARGTVNLLDALRRLDEPPPVVFTSTNKVYGALDDIELRIQDGRYQPVDERIGGEGIGEDRPLDFHSPYGCSKGTADQYIIDFARTCGVPGVVFRMSCIYGPRQFGTEDQGWVAHFLIKAMAGETVTLYGDGRQVRDILYIDDLVNAFLLAQANMKTLSGQAFNIGGGPRNTTSLLELMDLIEALHGRRPDLRYDDWRPADQRYYVSDTSKFRKATGWQPRHGVRDGVARLYAWLKESRKGLIAKANGRKRCVATS